MTRLDPDTLQRIARELFGLELSGADAERVLAQHHPWQEGFARLGELDLDGIEPDFRGDPGEDQG